MKIAIIDCGTNRIPELSEITGNYGAQYEVFTLEDIKAKNNGQEILSVFDAIIISGGPKIIDDSNRLEYLENYKYLKNIQSPILAICFGHQLIGHIYGCDYTMHETVIGTLPVDILTPLDPLFENVHEKNFRKNHSQSISLPEDFTLLAQAKSCSNEAMKHNTNLLYCVQFHPEASEKQGRVLIENFLRMCG